jgi:uncharacterized protein
VTPLLLLAFAQLAVTPPDQAAVEFSNYNWPALQARFSPQMKDAVGTIKLRLLEALGKCRPPVLPASATPGKNGMVRFVYRVECERQTIGLALTSAADGLIHGLFIVAPPAPTSAASDGGGLVVVTGQYRLPAALTLPAGAGPFPAVVLVHGSGPHDMDETIGPNKPFRDIASGLAAKGVATLRYTKRTSQYGASLPANITLREETIEDALSAVALLRKNPKLDPKRIYVIGHSLGAHAAPRIGQADPAIAGLVLLAGNTRPLDTLIDEQIRYLGGTPAQAVQMKGAIPEAYRKDLAAHDPVAIARGLKMPMLILQGERDYQVTMADFKGWQPLRSPRVTLKSYPALNHLFQAGEGKSTPAEYQKAAPFSAAVIADIAAWINR